MSGPGGEAAALALRLCTAARDADWRGSDPYDALWWGGWPRPLVRRRRGRQLLIQLHARAPLDPRPLYRRRHPLISKTLALFGTAIVRLQRAEPDGAYAELAHDALGRLAADETTGTPGFGYPFPVQTRWSFYDRNTPNAIATAFGVLALSEGAKTFGNPSWGVRADEAAAWALDALWSEERGWFVYHPSTDALVHNANLLVARAVARTLNGDERVARAVRHTLAAQRPDGTFPYGLGRGLEWADSFHTGYVLECLCELRDADPGVDAALRRGADAYRSRFFGAAGEAQLWPDRPFPQDGHSAGTALTTLAALATAGVVEPETIEPVARRVMTSVVRGSHAVHRRHRRWTTRLHYIRWCDGHVALGLAGYALMTARATASTTPSPSLVPAAAAEDNPPT
jgi:hypothetical protein